MKNLKQKIPFAASCVALAGLALANQISQAGWTGAMNGSGFGWAGVNVSSYLLTTNVIGTVAMTSPSAAMSPTTGYSTNGFLPKGASEKTFSRLKGFEGYVWQASTSASSGDKTDNFELENRVVIHGAPCPELMMESILTPNSFDGKVGSITVKTVGTAGTALWLRGFEVEPGTEVPVDDPATQNNETTDFLKQHSVLKFENLMVGPFEYGFNGKCELIIYFNLDGGNLNNLIFTSDSVAKSVPFTIECPPDQSVACDKRQNYTYPLPQAAGSCGNVTVTYSPAVSQLALGLNKVTVTAKDGKGEIATCTFNVSVTDTVAPKPDVESLPTITGQCSAAVLTVPTATDNCAGKIVGTTKDPLTYTKQGRYTIAWEFKDAAGNVTTQNQFVEVRDTIAPTAPVLPDVVSGSCLGGVTLTPPKAMDNCAGLVTGTTSTSFPITKLGTNVVTWTFNDGNGNSSSTTQRVIIIPLTFVGFYSPISAVGGECSAPAKQVKQGSVIPIKFDYKCGSTVITTGTPPLVQVQRWSTTCTPGAVPLSVNAEYQNDWHANWDTTGWDKGTYKIIVTLPDGSMPFVFVTLK